MMVGTLVVLAVVGLAGGLLLFLLPVSLWSGWFPGRSPWANQASVAGALLFSGLGLGGGAGLLSAGGDLFWGWRSRMWVPVEATVVDSRLVRVNQVRSTNPGFRHAVTYRYEAGGGVRVADRVAFGARVSPDHAAMEAERARRFAAGAPLIVRVAPDDPAQAVIEPGVQPKVGILAALGAVFLGISVRQLRALRRDWWGERLVANYDAGPRRKGRARSRSPGQRV